MEILAAIVFFGLCMAGMAVGVAVSGRRLRGSCGGVPVEGPDGEVLSCGACPRKEAAVCPSDDPLIELAQIAHPDPRKHH